MRYRWVDEFKNEELGEEEFERLIRYMHKRQKHPANDRSDAFILSDHNYIAYASNNMTEQSMKRTLR